MAERFEIALNTPAGQLTTALDVPTDFVPITAIVPLSRRLGEEAGRLEIHLAAERGQAVSCRMGCAACCRMLVPLSPPEAFALRDYIGQLPDAQRATMLGKIADTKARLKSADLLDRLWAVADATEPIPDEELDPLNRAYYAQRHACPFLQDEMCSIYEARPAACRELLVTSSPDLCEDLVNNPVTPLPVSLRIGTVLGILWGSMTQTAPRLIPLPIALDWAEQQEKASRRTWPGSALIDRLLDVMWRVLSQEFQARSKEHLTEEP
jgi:Fe-S-cluster containining protein